MGKRKGSGATAEERKQIRLLLLDGWRSLARVRNLGGKARQLLVLSLLGMAIAAGVGHFLSKSHRDALESQGVR